MIPDLSRLGWARFGHDPALARWVSHVAPLALNISRNPAHRRDWLRHGNTWFAGVNVLDNDTDGVVSDGPAFEGTARAALAGTFGPYDLEPAQISVVYPGYPGRDPDESDAAHRFRRSWDAAHVDGLLPVGPDRRRMIREPHAFVLGIPLNAVGVGASPLVVWEGSHLVMAQAFRTALRGVAPADWPDVDVTDAYQAARRECFERCPRVLVHASPGEAYVVHRLALHGVAPWDAATDGAVEHRIIAYFRPECRDGITQWLDAVR